jgi:chemotaxis protein MotA
MKAATGIGIGIALISLVIGGFLKGTQPMQLFNVAAFVIIVPTTLGCTIAACGMERAKLIPSLYKRVMSPPELNLPGTVRQMTGFAERARKDGLLALEEDVNGIEDEFTKKGMQLVVDGTDPDLLAEIMESDIEAMQGRHKANATMFNKAGAFAPTIGVMGTVVGLISVLGNLSAPETLGPKIAMAFIATLYGIGSANVFFIPIGTRLTALSADEAHARRVVLEGILAIQAGDNPRVVQEKLLSFLSPAEREEARGDDGPKLSAVPGGEQAQAA